MALSTARSFLSEACYGEQELDANSALMELDKGLFVSRVANQALSTHSIHLGAFPVCVVYWGNESMGHLSLVLMCFVAGLRSGKLGEQCEAVVLFPKLFQKYPFPILINSAFLKLADIFRLG